MSPHTPGPWFAVDCRHQKNGQIRIWGQREPEVVWSGYLANVLASNGRCEANARLIAAAPKLLAACKAIEFSARMGELLPNAMEMVRNAIAEAEGRS